MTDTQRVHKYKCWDKKRKQWLTEFQIMPNGAVRYKLPANESPDRLEWQEVDGVILVEFTGLHDKHGTEIYEGDILKYFGRARPAPEYRAFVDQGMNIFVVEYHLNRFVGIPVRYINEAEYCGGSELEDWLMSEDRFVIGNIYENPELLQS